MPEEIDLRLARREPFGGSGLLGVLGARAAAGLERLGRDGSYTRTVRLAGGPAVMRLWPAGDVPAPTAPDDGRGAGVTSWAPGGAGRGIGVTSWAPGDAGGETGATSWAPGDAGRGAGATSWASDGAERAGPPGGSAAPSTRGDHAVPASAPATAARGELAMPGDLVSRHGLATSHAPDTVRCVLRLADPRDLDAAVRLVRRLLDLDAEPAAIDAHLSLDPALAPLVARRPGLRVLGTVDGFELALRAVIGQQVSVAAARTVLGRIVVAHGESVGPELDPGPGFEGVPLRLLPTAATIAGLPDEALPMPRARAATVRRLAAAVAAGELDLGPDADPGAAVASLLALRGIGPWTAGYVAMRALRDPDAFPATDLVLRRSAAALGLPSDARRLEKHAERWSPWCAYAAQHLWAAAADPAG